MKKREVPKKPVKFEIDNENIVSLEDFKKARLGFDPGGSGENWLDQLPIGTLFYAENKHAGEFVAQEYLIVDKVPGIVIVRYFTAKNDSLVLPLLSNRFCNQHNLRYIRGT